MRFGEIASHINLDKRRVNYHLKTLLKKGKIQKIRYHYQLVFWGLLEHKLELSPEEIKDLITGTRRKWTKKKIIEEANKIMLKNGRLPPYGKVPSSLRSAARKHLGGWRKVKEALNDSSV